MKRMQHLHWVWWDNSRVSRTMLVQPSIVGPIQGGDGCVLNSLFSVQMFLVVWLSAGKGRGGDYTTLSLTHSLSEPSAYAKQEVGSFDFFFLRKGKGKLG